MRCIWPAWLTAMIFTAILAALIPGCTPPPENAPREPVRQEMSFGDRQREWAMVFFQSWRRDHNVAYLSLSRSHMATAVKTYFRLQVRIGHSYPDFYLLDRRRRQGCRFLEEIDNLAKKFQVPLDDEGREGCLRKA